MNISFKLNKLTKLVTTEMFWNIPRVMYYCANDSNSWEVLSILSATRVIVRMSLCLSVRPLNVCRSKYKQCSKQWLLWSIIKFVIIISLSSPTSSDSTRRNDPLPVERFETTLDCAKPGRGRPLGRHQSAGRRPVDARSAHVWSSVGAALAVCVAEQL